jgi:hypothetical protein
MIKQGSAAVATVVVHRSMLVTNSSSVGVRA